MSLFQGTLSQIQLMFLLHSCPWNVKVTDWSCHLTLRSVSDVGVHECIFTENIFIEVKNSCHMKPPFSILYSVNALLKNFPIIPANSVNSYRFGLVRERPVIEASTLMCFVWTKHGAIGCMWRQCQQDNDILLSHLGLRLTCRAHDCRKSRRLGIPYKTLHMR